MGPDPEQLWRSLWQRQWQQAGSPHRLALAYSGGLDSRLLLEWLCRWCATQPAVRLHAFHIHHGLSAQADHWLMHCAATAQALGVHFASQRLQLHADTLARDGVEQAARTARYAALATLCQQAQIRHLLLAHQRDDQAETVLLQLLRGAGIAGLAGMAERYLLPTTDIRLLRPLLTFSRATLAHWVQAHGLSHIEDESNQDRRYARNALRHDFLPRLEQRFPGGSACIARSAAHLQQSFSLLQEYAAEDWARLCPQAPQQTQRLPLAPLLVMSQARRENLLRYWLHARGWRMPSQAQSLEVWRQLQAADLAQLCVTLDSGLIRVYQGDLCLTPRLDLRQPPPHRLEFRWQGEARLSRLAWPPVFSAQRSGF